MKPICILPDILQNSASLFAEKEAIVEGRLFISYRDLKARSDALARYLIERGVKKGDRVGIFLEKSIEAVISIFGVSKAGGVFVNINPKLTLPQVLYRIDNCGVRCVITSNKKSRGLKGAGSFFIVDVREFNSVFDSYSKGPARDIDLTEDDLAAILYTSGSTGYPKGVMLGHGNLVLGTKIVTGYLENTDKDIIISVLPFNFDYGLNQLLTTVFVGATLVLQRSMFVNDICDTLKSKRITGFAGIPSIWVMLLQPMSMFRKSQFPRLRYITNSGGAIPVKYICELKKVLGETKIYLMYGLTEAFRSTYLEPGEIDNRPTSIGKAVDGVAISVVNKEGKECQPEEPGELVHRGGVIFKGYWNDPEATSKVLRPMPFDEKKEPVVWSADTVKKDKDGFLYFLGRNDETIKCLGYRISPQEIEDVLCKIDEIREAVVFGVQDEMLGQRIKAVVSLGFRNISEKQITDFCKKYLPSYMVPHDIEIIDEFPKTSTGKIDRLKIKERNKEPVDGFAQSRY